MSGKVFPSPNSTPRPRLLTVSSLSASFDPICALLDCLVIGVLVLQVRVGDQVISVDGQSVDGRNLLDMLRGDGSVGSMKVIKFRSPQGAVTEAAICRTPMSDVDRLGAVIESLEKLEERIKAGADKGVLLDLHREVAKHVMENADSQLAKQQALANRLLVTQLAVSDGVNALLARLHPLGPNSPPPAAAPQDNVEQLKRQLDESMANTDALRQRAKHLTEQVLLLSCGLCCVYGE